MLTKPDLPDDQLLACLHDSYGVTARKLKYLPLGADFAAWVYRVEADDSKTYFLKLRKGRVDEVSLMVPRYLKTAGATQVVAALSPTSGEQPWATVADYAVLLYPFISGANAMELGLTTPQWVEYGAVLKQIHSVRLSHDLQRRVPRETFVPNWSRGVRQLQTTIEQLDQRDRHVRELAAIWREKRDQITQIVERAEELGRLLQTRHGEFVLCHTDIHLANVLVDPAGRLHVVDWDAPLQAPKERDLHFVVESAIGRIPIGPREEELIFQGYGPTTLDWEALTYYRFDWVSGDLLEYGKQVCLVEDASAASKEHAIQRTRRMFEPGRSVDSAYALERRRPSTHCDHPGPT
ncbi:MAG TPA: aminoglycoside phosphotransferase family protein [Chloroflexota bacterium]|jgi:spectinomycin phosphotransferase|nr:aminoglycoside phosphotransferase family protein [Chloroflexota bacterium]